MQKIKKFVLGFWYAAQGIAEAFKGRNMRIHGLATLVVISFGLLIKLEFNEWAVVLILIGAVWALEIVNTAIEDIANVLRDSGHLSYTATKSARDLAAGAVLVMAVVAIIIAGLILKNHLG